MPAVSAPTPCREVAGLLDGHRDPFTVLRAGGERERVILDRERRSSDREPGELARQEPHAGVAHRPQHERPRPAALADDLVDDPRQAEQPEGDHEAHVEEQTDDRQGHGRPQQTLPGQVHVPADELDVDQGEGEAEDGEDSVGDAPVLVAEPQLTTPDGDRHEDEESQRRGDGEARSPRRRQDVEQLQRVRACGEEDQRVRDRDRDGEDRDLPVEAQDDVDAVGCGDVTEPCGDGELEADHRQRDEPEGDGELRPEVPGGMVAIDERHEERSE